MLEDDLCFFNIWYHSVAIAPTGNVNASV